MTISCSDYLVFAFERSLPVGVRGLLYAFGILYCFLGLSSITARFFLGMETIVQQTRKVAYIDPESGLARIKRERVWNCTVADITLLAFGTSFPQISLATIEAFMDLGNLYAGGLGPGTLVGSAACDLYLIHAVCIIVPKKGRIKKISDLGVWAVELAWSLWAYVWLYIILKVWTPEVITPWEAVATISQYFLLILHSYAQDQRWPFISISILGQRRREDWISSEVDNENLSTLPQNSRKETLCTQGGNNDDACSLQQACHGENPEIRKMPEINTLSLLTCSSDSQKPEEELEMFTWSRTKILWRQQFSDCFTLRESRHSNGKWRTPVCWHIWVALWIFPWKFVFAFVPPHTLCHGWATFCCSLLYITGISYIVTKLTDLFGCVTGINSFVVALTLLATGTSWPDLVASTIAAHRQSTANSALANITCSNSVNIFIGIGVPWFVDSIYNRIILHEELRVPSGELGFILIIYFITFILCTLVLIGRRYFLGGELGGPRNWAWMTSGFILFLWIIFLVLSCLRVYTII